MGGGTTKVGDPTDKEKSRPMLTDEQIATNIAGNQIGLPAKS
jgi:tyrosyl-tRNA synthetase